MEEFKRGMRRRSKRRRRGRKGQEEEDRMEGVKKGQEEVEEDLYLWEQDGTCFLLAAVRLSITASAAFSSFIKRTKTTRRL